VPSENSPLPANNLKTITVTSHLAK
jgi:hypothetical protein